MKILVTGLYIDPTTDTSPRTILYYSVQDSAEDAVNFIRDNFDGQDTFDETYAPQIIDHLNNSADEYVLDDYSAGQWFYVRIIGDAFEKIEELKS